MTIAHSAAHKASADGYIHACRRKIVSINPSLTLIMAASVAAEHHEHGQLGFLEITRNVQRYSGLWRAGSRRKTVWQSGLAHFLKASLAVKFCYSEPNCLV
jgi:hypothetical protein